MSPPLMRSRTRSRRHLDGTVGGLSTIDKSGVVGLSEHVSGARAGRHLESDGSVTESVLRPRMTIRAKYDSLEVTPRPILVMPQGAKKSQRGAKSSQGLGAIQRSRNTPNLSSQLSNLLLLVNGGSKVKPIERRSRSAYCCLRSDGGVGCKVLALLRGFLHFCWLRTIERRRRSTIGRRSRSTTKASKLANDRTEASIGNQESRTGRFARVSLLQLIERTRRSVSFCYKVEREKLGGCDDDRSGRFDGGCSILSRLDHGGSSGRCGCCRRGGGGRP
jgi:hypothetical protein